MNTVFCIKYRKNLPALLEAPMKNDLGKKILVECSENAWNDWLQEQTKIINENRMNMLNDDDRELLLEEARKFLFGNEKG